MRPLPALVLISCLLALPGISLQAEELSVSPTDTLQSLLEARKGKTVTLRLSDGEEITGVVREATGSLVVLGSLSGREFFDAAVALEKIEAVIVRNQ